MLHVASSSSTALGFGAAQVATVARFRAIAVAPGRLQIPATRRSSRSCFRRAPATLCTSACGPPQDISACPIYTPVRTAYLLYSCFSQCSQCQILCNCRTTAASYMAQHDEHSSSILTMCALARFPSTTEAQSPQVTEKGCNLTGTSYSQPSAFLQSSWHSNSMLLVPGEKRHVVPISTGSCSQYPDDTLLGCISCTA